jgi:hypothetical protein
MWPWRDGHSCDGASVSWAIASASIACGLGLLIALAGRRALAISPAAA